MQIVDRLHTATQELMDEQEVTHNEDMTDKVDTYEIVRQPDKNGHVCEPVASVTKYVRRENRERHLQGILSRDSWIDAHWRENRLDGFMTDHVEAAKALETPTAFLSSVTDSIGLYR